MFENSLPTATALSNACQKTELCTHTRLFNRHLVRQPRNTSHKKIRTGLKLSTNTSNTTSTVTVIPISSLSDPHIEIQSGNFELTYQKTLYHAILHEPASDSADRFNTNLSLPRNSVTAMIRCRELRITYILEQTPDFKREDHGCQLLLRLFVCTSWHCNFRSFAYYVTTDNSTVQTGKFHNNIYT